MIDRVSVIIPCFNRSKYLHEWLDSIAKQTYSNIEIIVVDDASTEDLKSVVDNVKWPDSYTIQFIRLGENRGPGYAREMGRQHATGLYINYQDSDDIFHPEKIALQVAFLKQNPKAGMCYCITLNFTSFPFDGTERLRGSHYIASFLPGVIEKRPWATGSCLWTREATDIIGPWFDGRGNEDLIYDIHAGCKNIQLIYFPQILMYVRNHSGDADVRAPSIKKYQIAIIAYHEMLNVLSESGKLSNLCTLVAITDEIFRVCRKLFDYQVTDDAISILHHLILVGRSKSRIQCLYLLIAKFILFSRLIIVKRYQSKLFSKMCHFGMIIGNLHSHKTQD